MEWMEWRSENENDGMKIKKTEYDESNLFQLNYLVYIMLDVIF